MISAFLDNFQIMSDYCLLFWCGFLARNTKIQDILFFLHKNLKENVGKLKKNIVYTFEIKLVFKSYNFYKSSIIFRKTSLVIDSHFNLVISLHPDGYLTSPPPNMNSIREVCDSPVTKSLTLFVGNHWATGWLRWTPKCGNYKQSFVCLHWVEMQTLAVGVKTEP